MEESEFYPNSDEEELARQQLEDYKERCKKETTEWNYPPVLPNRPAGPKQRLDGDEDLLTAYQLLECVDIDYTIKQCPMCHWWFKLRKKQFCTQFVHVLPCRTCNQKLKGRAKERDLIADVEINTVPPNSPSSSPSTESKSTTPEETGHVVSSSRTTTRRPTITSSPSDQTESFRNPSPEKEEASDSDSEPDYTRRRVNRLESKEIIELVIAAIAQSPEEEREELLQIFLKASGVIPQ